MPSSRSGSGPSAELRAPRVTAELNDNTPAGERVNHKRVARVMRAEGIVAM
ncbi:hypothetical protein GCM10025862_42320 [Arsenicicoccus piscis]|uniref:HTH-like domain-containing protein n=1 Tax=Arsenicicoccus piscis TaxID=673954 RepID=A0ABQ6HUM8_9MICO|nr:hypothetical protein GCM10025862_42320 [Arsenicicoccus piscis]